MNRSNSNDAAALIHQHLAYARRLAKSFFSDRHYSGFDLEDFESSAMMGLCDAARRYDETKGQRFKTFAFFRIRGAMYDMLRSDSGISRQHYNRIMRNQSDSKDPDYEGVRMVSEEDLPYAFAKNVSDLANLVSVLNELSLKLYVDNKGRADLSYANEQTPEDIAIVSSTRRYLQMLLQQLPEKQRKIIELRYLRGKTFNEISEEMGGISKSWMSRIHSSALDALKEIAYANKAGVMSNDIANV